jgi:aquaporin Z
MVFAKMLSEFVGTFILLSGILLTGNAVYIAAAFLAAITIAGVSGGHINPVVSLIMALKGAITFKTMAEFIVAQVGGAVAASVVSKVMKGKL